MKNEIINVLNGILNKPGDKFEASVTKSGNKVVKISSGDGLFKASKTVYPNGTVHETRTYKQ